LAKNLHRVQVTCALANPVHGSTPTVDGIDLTLGDHRVDELASPTNGKPTKSLDLVKIDRPRGETWMLERRIVSFSDCP
jgi:hypothetical protein